jgi:putative hemolysin
VAPSTTLEHVAAAGRAQRHLAPRPAAETNARAAEYTARVELLADIVGPPAAAPGWTSLALSALLILVLAALSACYSGSEPALFSLTRMQVQHLRQDPSALRRLTATLLDHPKRTLTIILLGNTAANVLLFSSIYVLFERLAPVLGGWSGVVAAVFSTVLVSLVCEALPKTLAISMADRVAPLVAPLVHFSGLVLGPLGRLLDFVVVEPLRRVLWGARAGRELDLTTVELKTLLQMSRRQGVINPLEDQLLSEVIDLGYLRVRDVMIPRVEVLSYDINADPDGLRRLMRDSRRKKVPVYERTVDNMVGLVYAKVLFLNPGKPLRSLLQPVRFVPELATCEQLLHHFRTTRTQLAIVVDEYGGMAGLVTLEDVIEAIVGDLPSPGEQAEEPEIAQLSEREFEVAGSLGVHYWGQAFRLPPIAEHVATVGGLVLARLGHAPRVGDMVQIGDLDLRVTRVQGRRIERVRLRIRSDGDAAGSAAPPAEGPA